MDTSALGGLSSSCQAALPSLLTSSFATCSQVIQLVQVATGSGSVVPEVDSYIQGVCTSSPCQQSDLDNAKSIITSGCSQDIQQGALIPSALNLIVENYGGIRSILCTQRTSNSSYCVPEVLYAAQNETGVDFTFSELSQLYGGGNGTSLLGDIPSSVYCTDCGHAITTEALALVQNVSATNYDQARSAAEQQCGAAFGDGQLPEGITTSGSSGVQSASTGKNNTGAAASSFNPKSVMIYGTVLATLAGALVTIV